MAKDPRFNFYPDNWTGGTKRMSFEQKGAYMELLLLNFYCLSDDLPGFTEEEALKSLAHAPAYTELWNFLKTKFQTDGKLFWSERMQKEFQKSKKHSQYQTEKANKRWKKNPADAPAHAFNGTGNGNGIPLKKESEIKTSSHAVVDVPRETIPPPQDGPKPLNEDGFEPLTDEWFNNIFDEMHISDKAMTYREHDVADQLLKFKSKVRGSPAEYIYRDTASMRSAFDYHLRHTKPNKHHVRTNTQGSSSAASAAIITGGKGFGDLRRNRTDGGRKD